MIPRSIISEREELIIFLDSKSMEISLRASDSNTQKLLLYNDLHDKMFEFIRSPSNKTKTKLKNITELQLKYDKMKKLTGLSAIKEDKILGKKLSSRWFFGYKMDDIKHIGKVVYKKKRLSNEELNPILLVFIQAVLNRHATSLFVTENKVLLKNRLWFESHFPGGELNICTTEEALEMMDLFSKYRGKYLITPIRSANEGAWYWTFFRSKIPNFHTGDLYLDALSNRFIFLLMAVDKIGFEYYSGVNNDTMTNTIYHFNYFISLVSGIFDNLALRTKAQYNLKFKWMKHPSRTSLYNKNGKEFLKALRKENPKLRKHINAYVDFINLIYHLRERIVHKEFLRDTGIRYSDEDSKWDANILAIPKKVATCIKECGDKKQKYDPFTEWGVYELLHNYYLEPFRFVKSAIQVLIKFCNDYLKMLGFKNFIVEQKRNKKNVDFIGTIDLLRKNCLSIL